MLDHKQVCGIEPVSSRSMRQFLARWVAVIVGRACVGSRLWHLRMELPGQEVELRVSSHSGTIGAGGKGKQRHKSLAQAKDDA